MQVCVVWNEHKWIFAFYLGLPLFSCAWMEVHISLNESPGTRNSRITFSLVQMADLALNLLLSSTMRVRGSNPFGSRNSLWKWQFSSGRTTTSLYCYLKVKVQIFHQWHKCLSHKKNIYHYCFAFRLILCKQENINRRWTSSIMFSNGKIWETMVYNVVRNALFPISYVKLSLIIFNWSLFCLCLCVQSFIYLNGDC